MTKLVWFFFHSNSNVAEQDDDKYKLHIVQLQEIIESKNKDIETLESTLHLKETMLSTQTEELNGKCKILEEQKGNSKDYSLRTYYCTTK